MFQASHPHDRPPPGAALVLSLQAADYGRSTLLGVKTAGKPDWWASVLLPAQADGVTVADQLRRLADAIAPDGGPD